MQIAKVNYIPKPAPFGQAKVLANQQLEVNFTYPDPQQFKTQAFGCGEVSYAKIEVTGPALGNTSLYANGADAVHKMITASNCQVSAIVNAIPYGDLVVNIRLYDSNRNLLAGSELISGFNISEANPRLEMSYRQTNVGQILNQLRASNQVADEFLAGQLDLDALQTFIDTLTDLGGTFPHYTFTHHPALINVASLVADLRTNDGNVAALDPLNPDYVQTPGSTRLDLQGLLTVDTVTASQLTVTVPAGLALGSQTVTVAKGDAQAATSLSYTVVKPAITTLNVTAGEIGSQVKITGTQFNPDTSKNKVMFGSVEATVELASTTELTVSVPPGIFGTVPVTVANLQSPASNAENYAITPKVTGLSVTTGSSGDTVTLTGNGFTPTSANNSIKLGTHTLANPVAIGSTQLKITVPNVPAGTANSSVQVGAQISATAAFSILPKITTLTTAEAVSGKAVLIRNQILTITGTNFDPVKANNSITFTLSDNSTATVTGANLISANAAGTEIQVAVPAGVSVAGDVNVVVTTNTKDSLAAVGTVPEVILNITNGGFH